MVPTEIIVSIIKKSSISDYYQLYQVFPNIFKSYRDEFIEQKLSLYKVQWQDPGCLIWMDTKFIDDPKVAWKLFLKYNKMKKLSVLIEELHQFQN